jgi:hypothetical protein
MLTVFYPVVRVDDLYVAVSVGAPEVEFGDTTDLRDKYNKTTVEDLTVVGIDVLPADEVAQEVLDLLGARSVEDLVRGLSRSHGTSFSTSIPVVIYTLSVLTLDQLAMLHDLVVECE